MDFQEQRGIACCGLACVLCSVADCLGCKARGCSEGSDCSVLKCVTEKELDGCYVCAEYDSCTESMPHGKRNIAFNHYAKEYGKQALIERLRINYENGITYHRPDKLLGDYDALETTDEIYRLLRYGRNDPYTNCPEFDTEHFHLRQVRMEDAADLLCFYGDLTEWMFSDNAWSNGIFTSNHPTLKEMQKCIASWLDEYRNRFYIRFSVIDQITKKSIGTIEVFDNVGKDKNQKLDIVKRGAALHIDLSVPYEACEYISEMLTLADKEFHNLFGMNYLLIRAIPSAEERIAALTSAGYEPFEWERGREHYYMKKLGSRQVR